MSDSKLEFWFEMASPYSYISAMRINQAVEERGVLVDWKPFLLGPFFKTQGWHTTPFNIQTVKGEYMWLDVERRCKKFGIPFSKPSIFPINSVYSSRVILAAFEQGRAKGIGITHWLYKQYFQKNKDIGDKNTLKEILRKLGESPFIGAIDSNEMKNRLRIQTEKALELKIFGAPMFIYNGERFWGDDRLEDLREKMNK